MSKMFLEKTTITEALFSVFCKSLIANQIYLDPNLTNPILKKNKNGEIIYREDDNK